MALSFHDVLRALARGERLPDVGEAVAAIDAHEAAEAPAAAADGAPPAAADPGPPADYQGYSPPGGTL